MNLQVCSEALSCKSSMLCEGFSLFLRLFLNWDKNGSGGEVKAGAGGDIGGWCVVVH